MSSSPMFMPPNSNMWGGNPAMSGPYQFNPGGSGGSPSGGSNQFFPSMPSLPTAHPGGQQTGQSSQAGSPWNFNWQAPGGGYVGPIKAGSGIYGEQPINPSLTGTWDQFLKSQIGQGVQANPLLQQLLSFFGGGQSSLPGAGILSTIANQGISALPEWQSMIAAQQRNIGENQANLKEQFAFGGGLAGSPFGTAMSDYMSQTSKDQNALLGQLQQQNILQGQIPVAQGLMQGAQGLGMYGQSLLPQNNPLNQLIAQQADTFQPLYNTKKGGGVLGGLLPSLAGAAGGGIAAGIGGGGAADIIMGILAGLCHVAASFWGWDSPKTTKIRKWMVTQAPMWLFNFYRDNAEWLAQTDLRFALLPMFKEVLAQAE